MLEPQGATIEKTAAIEDNEHHSTNDQDISASRSQVVDDALHHDRNKDESIEQAQAFIDQHVLDGEHLPLFKRAIGLARQPSAYETLPDLEEDERVALRDEVTRKWHLPRAVWMTTVLCSIGAAVQGWDQTGINAANLQFPKQFSIGSNSARDTLLVGLINAMPQLATVCVGCWCSEPLNDRFGRRGAIFVSAVFAFCSVLGSAFTQTWQQLLICRILLGIGIGIKLSIVPVFAAEGAPAAVRGALVMGWQLWVAFGQFLGFSANIAVENAGEITWRLQLGSAFIPAVSLMLMIYCCPESPRWHIKKGRIADAFDSLLKLRNHPIQAARDLVLLHNSVKEEQAIIRRAGNTITRFCQLFTVPRLRRASLAATIVMLSQQLCGINIIAFYSSTIFTTSGVPPKTAFWISWGWSLVTFLSTLPALRIIDTFGRRSLLLSTFPHMAWTLLATGLCFLIPDQNSTSTSRLAAIGFLIFLFSIIYSLGSGPVTFVYSAEVFPLSHREIGMAWSVCVNAIGSFVLSLTFPYMLAAMSPTGAFGFYCGTNVVSFVAILVLVPETRVYSLEELDFVFGVETREFVRFQICRAVPFWVKRWILWRRRKERLEPLVLPACLNSLAEQNGNGRGTEDC